jgi:hypothetical protein
MFSYSKSNHAWGVSVNARATMPAGYAYLISQRWLPDLRTLDLVWSFVFSQLLDWVLTKLPPAFFSIWSDCLTQTLPLPVFSVRTYKLVAPVAHSSSLLRFKDQSRKHVLMLNESGEERIGSTYRGEDQKSAPFSLTSK